MSNFSFFKDEWAVLAKLGESAERNVYVDPNTTISKLRLLGETIAKAVLASDNIREFRDTNQVERLNVIQREGLAEAEMLEIFHLLRKKGNKASHDGIYGTSDEALQLLALAYQLSIWFMEVYTEAVLDGYLVDHEPPYLLIMSKFKNIYFHFNEVALFFRSSTPAN